MSTAKEHSAQRAGSWSEPKKMLAGAAFTAVVGLAAYMSGIVPYLITKTVFDNLVPIPAHGTPEIGNPQHLIAECGPAAIMVAGYCELHSESSAVSYRLENEGVRADGKFHCFWGGSGQKFSAEATGMCLSVRPPFSLGAPSK